MVQYKHTEFRQAREKRKAFVCLCWGGTGNEGAWVPLDGERERKGTEEDEITGWIT